MLQDGKKLVSQEVALNDLRADKVLTSELFGPKSVVGELTSRSGLLRWLRVLFLPSGYPDSVSDSYLRYVKYTFLQVTLNNTNRVLATQAMLLAVGVGNALPVAAALNWVLKDGIGHLGSIVVSASINRDFDSDPKRYRFQAVTLGQVANLLSILSLSFPLGFLLLNSIGSSLSRVGVVQHISSRARIYEDFSKIGNLGDTMRASQAQTTAAALLGTVLGVALAPAVLPDVAYALGIFFPVAAVTQYFAYRSTDSVILRTFNTQRAEILIADFFASSKAMTPEAVAKVEIFIGPPARVFDVNLFVNAEINEALLIGVEKFNDSCFFMTRAGENSVQLWIKEGATSAQVLQGFYEACRLRSQAERVPEFNIFLQEIKEAGWNTEIVFLDDHYTRVTVA